MADNRGDGLRLSQAQRELWLSQALEQLPIAIGLIDAQGRCRVLAGGLKDLFGALVSARNPQQQSMWEVFDKSGRALGVSEWPGERQAMGEHLCVYRRGAAEERRLWMLAMPFEDSAAVSAGVVLVRDADEPDGARDLAHVNLKQRFIDTLNITGRNVETDTGAAPANARGRVAGAKNHSQAERSDSLSPREEEVLRLLAWGKSRKEISIDLGIAVKTVEFHRASAARKIGFKSRVDMVRYAVERGWFGAGS